MSLVALALASIPLAGAPVQEVTLSNTEVRTLRSAIVDQEFRLLVARPFGPPTSASGKYPVVYALDADLSFPMLRQIALSLSSGFDLPPVVIVGIAYAGGEREGMLRRNRDYTPTPDPVFSEYAAGWGGPPGPDTTGQAAAFLAFVREELEPFVEAEYPVDPEDATVFGVSFGGLFATYALLQEPDTFQRYVIGSPSLWWGGRVVFEYEERYADEHDDLAARVFIGVGGHETSEHDEAFLARVPAPMRRSMLELNEALDGGMRMVEVVEPFVATLAGRGYPSLDLTLHVFPGETHGSAPPMIASRGLRVVFGTL